MVSSVQLRPWPIDISKAEIASCDYPPTRRRGRNPRQKRITEYVYSIGGRSHDRKHFPARTESSSAEVKKRGDRAFVDLSGQRRYLGLYGSPESKQAYDRIIAEWLASGRRAPTPAGDLSIVELIAPYWQYAEQHYRKPNGEPTSSLIGIKSALKVLRHLYGFLPAESFGPKALRAVRAVFIRDGLSRGVCNQYTGIIRQVFKWAVAQELVPPTTHQALQAVAGLKRGRTDAKDREPVKPVPQAHVEAIEQHVSRQVWALVQLQLLTGARAGELVIMRVIDLDMTADVWTFIPQDHKGSHHGHQRTIYVGPKGQRVIAPFLAGRPTDGFLFSPREAEEKRLANRHAARVTPHGYGNAIGTNRVAGPQRRPEQHYTTRSYARAVRRACEVAKVPTWNVHRLRHNSGTFLRKQFGLDMVRIILSHKSPAVTEVYAEIDREKAINVIRQIG